MSNGALSMARLGRLRDVMAGYVGRGDVPGLVTLVSRRGETHADALGTLAVGGRDPMRRIAVRIDPTSSITRCQDVEANGVRATFSRGSMSCGSTRHKPWERRLPAGPGCHG